MDTDQFLRRLDTTRNCIHVSAEELQICWGDNPKYWEMVPNHGTELSNMIARLKAVCWFDVKGEVACSLSPGTYTVSWRVYVSTDARGWESDAVYFTFSKKQNDIEDISRCNCYLKRSRSPVVLTHPPVVLTHPEPTVRAVGNGWTEYDVGEFAVEEEGNLALEFAMVATSDNYWKTGLSLDGVVIRLKSSVDDAVPLRLESSSSVVRSP